MKFTEIYEKVVVHWGIALEFSDASLTTPENPTPGTNPSATGGLYSAKLSKRWSEVEDIVGTDDTFGDLMVWTMYQVFHRHAVKLFQQGITTLSPNEIDKTEIESQYFVNLHAEGWEDELAKYTRSLG